MSRSGTRKKDIRKRNGRAQKAGLKSEIFKRRLRRAGLVSGAVIFVLWLAAWAWLSGSVHRGVEWAENSFYQATVDSGFVVKEVLLEGRVNSNPDILRALMNVERGDSILRFDPDTTKDMLERVSWVKEAHIERRLPDTIYVGLLERKPIALWQYEGKIKLIDSDGVVLTDKNIEEFKDLVLVVGENAPAEAKDILAMTSLEPLIGERLEAVSKIGDRRWDLRLKGGITVKLPEKDIGLAVKMLADAQVNDRLMDKDIIAIDMRDLERITVRTRPGRVNEYRAGSEI
jgi:cell division protein FtsQ